MICHQNYFRKLLGIDAHIDQELVQEIIDFTLVFSLAEQKLMGGNGSIRDTHTYAATLSQQYGMNADVQFEYFHHRYITKQNADEYLDNLCPKKPRDRETVRIALMKANPSNAEKIEAVLNVCIRLRHNLFHGNKWAYEFRGQEKNLRAVTSLLSEYLNRAA